MRLRPLAVTVLLLFGGPGAAAQSTILGEVRVTAPRLDTRALFARAILGEDLRSRRAASSDTASLLKQLPGVDAYGAGGVSSLPVMRGLADERLRIQVDGMDLLAACPNHMNPALSYLHPTQVGDIQVYTGVSPVSLGGDAIGGSILVRSAPPSFAPVGVVEVVSAEVGAHYRSNGNGIGVNLRANRGGERLAVAYLGAYARADNYKAGANFKAYDFTGRVGHTLARDEVGASAYEAANHALDLAWRNEDHLVEASYLRQQIPFQGYPNQRMDMTDNVSDKLSLALTGRYEWGTLTARLYHEAIEHAMDFGPDKRYWYGSASGGPTATSATPCSPIGPNCAAGMPMYAEGRSTGLSLVGERPLTYKDRLRLGAEWRVQRLDDWWMPSGAMMWPGTFWNIRDGQRDRYALFGEWEGRRGAWTHILGLRHELVKMEAGPVQGYKTNIATPPMPGTDVGNQIAESTAFNASDRSKTDHNWDLAWLARITPAAGQSYELGLARKTRSPGIYERYTWSTWQMAALMNNFVGDGNGYVGDVNLKPEVAYTLSLAGAWSGPGDAWGLRLSPYYSRVADYIDAVCLTNCANPNTFRVLRYANFDAELYGIEVSAHIQLGAPEVLGSLRLEGSLGYTRGRNLDTKDDLYNIKPLTARLSLSQRKGPWSGRIETEYVAGKDKRSSVRNEMHTGAYGLVHLRGSYEWARVRLDFGVENLFDRLYHPALGGAYVGQGTSMTLPPAPNQPQWGTPVPGPGRNLYVGVNLRF